MNYAKQLHVVDYAQQKLELKRMSIIEKAARSSNPEDVIAASAAAEKIREASRTSGKAFFIDPLDFNANLGYKDKPFSLSYSTLKRMSAAPIINAIIKTRKNQIADYAEPQADRYSTGFVIRKRVHLGEDVVMSREERRVANELTDFILSCGGGGESWTNDDFDTFIRKIVDDSLTYDQMTFECIRNRRGRLERFVAVDASTFRMADSAFYADYNNPWFRGEGSRIWFNRDMTREDIKAINGYYPQFVQVYQNAVVNEFYPWELCFAVRNPSTSIYSNGYGCSELEELISVVTSMLYSDEYNKRFFSQGSAPKGLLRVKGGMNESALQQFKQQWQAMITGVMQSWKTPVVEADVDWIDLQKSNRDMEYTSWNEYLIKLACAIYSIDPSEIGWDISRSGGNSGLFEASQAERIQNSKDKGLYPILKFIQRKINKYIISQINPDFEFVFMGLNGMTIEQELDMDMKKLQSFQTLNEIRAKWDLPELEVAGDIIENSVFYQAYMQTKQQQQAGAEQGSGGGGEDEAGGSEEEGEEEENNARNYGEDYNPFSFFANADNEEEEGGGSGSEEEGESNDESAQGNEEEEEPEEEEEEEEEPEEENEEEEEPEEENEEEEEPEEEEEEPEEKQGNIFNHLASRNNEEEEEPGEEEEGEEPEEEEPEEEEEGEPEEEEEPEEEHKSVFNHLASRNNEEEPEEEEGEESEEEEDEDEDEENEKRRKGEENVFVKAFTAFLKEEEGMNVE